MATLRGHLEVLRPASIRQLLSALHLRFFLFRQSLRSDVVIFSTFVEIFLLLV